MQALGGYEAADVNKWDTYKLQESIVSLCFEEFGKQSHSAHTKLGLEVLERVTGGNFVDGLLFG